MIKTGPQFYLAVLSLFGLFLNSAGPAESVVRISPALPPMAAPLPPFESRLVTMGFVDVQSLDADIRVELKYASTDNFMAEAVYGDFKKAYLRREAAQKLALANRYLKELRPGHTLLVGDALRPRAVSWKMWTTLSGKPMQRYVADPRGGSMHNYGCAVDITICDLSGRRLDMGAPMDFFGPLAEPRHEERFLKEGKLTEEQVENRRLLRHVMSRAGFQSIQLEWWHFEAFDKKLIRTAYPIVE
ncbi:zinc D-Ala-D-Ala dipeptidase [uncultured bacterium]|nr:zinc D-Ala-D-Ala dipeptidase [uncultured bacterium]